MDNVLALRLMIAVALFFLGCSWFFYLLLNRELDKQRDLTFEAVTVIKVVDGDTLKVRMADGMIEKVRLIGIDCPESVHPDAFRNSKEGFYASRFTQSLVTFGDVVYLQKDISDRDKYDRLLRYVWLEYTEDFDDEEEAKNKMLNAMILINGSARISTYEPDTYYEDIFKALSKCF